MTNQTSLRTRSFCVLLAGLVTLSVAGPASAQDENFFDEEDNDARAEAQAAEAAQAEAAATEATGETDADTMSASDAAQVERLAALGRKHYKNGEYEKAISAYWKAYLLFDDAIVLYNIGRSYEKLGDLDRAKESYARCLSSADLDPSVRQRIEARLVTVEYEQRLLDPNAGGAEAPPKVEKKKSPATPPSTAEQAAPSTRTTTIPPPAPGYDDRPYAQPQREQDAEADIWTSMAPVSLAAGAFALTAVTLVGALVAGLLLYRGITDHQTVEDAKGQTDGNGTAGLSQREAAALVESGTVDKAWGVTIAGASAFVFMLGTALGVSAVATAYLTGSE